MTKARDLANAADVLDDVSATELSYVNGVTSSIQTQINGKQAVVSGVNDTEIGYLDGVTSAIQTQLDAKTAKSTLTTTGDIYYASAANTPARLGIGSTDQILKVTGGVPAWATPASAGGMTLLSTTTLTGTGVTVSSISQDYNYLIIVYSGINITSNGADVSARPNNAAASHFNYFNSRSSSVFNTNSSAIFENQSQWTSANTNNGHTLVIYDYNSAVPKAFNVSGVYQSSNQGAVTSWLGSGGINTTDPITSFRIQVSAGTFDAGTIKIYGVK